MAPGCASPLSAGHYRTYYDTGLRQMEKGAFQDARMSFHRATVNAQMGMLGPETEAYAWYEWATASGYLHLYEDAERGFRETLELIDRSKGKAGPLRAPAL